MIPAMDERKKQYDFWFYRKFFCRAFHGTARLNTSPDAGMSRLFHKIGLAEREISLEAVHGQNSLARC
jgi:hypothetical protein